MNVLCNTQKSLPRVMFQIEPIETPIYQVSNIKQGAENVVKEIYKCFDWIEKNTKYAYQDIGIKWIKEYGNESSLTLKAYAPKEEWLLKEKTYNFNQLKFAFVLGEIVGELLIITVLAIYLAIRKSILGY